MTNGSPAKHCGVIIEGQAIAFKIDGSGKRYQLCLEEGCFIGLETLQENSLYNAKVVAATNLEVFFWNSEGLFQLIAASKEFGSCLQLLDDGRKYQEQWLIPASDVTDPVLSSQPAHWLSVIAPGFVILPILFVFLWACALLVRRYPIAWVLVFGFSIAAGSLLYKQIISRRNERLIVTSKNVIHFPQNEDSEISINRLYHLQSITVEQNFIKRLINAGKICLQTDETQITTPLLHAPLRTAKLIQYFAMQASLGRKIPLQTNGELIRQIDISEENKSESTAAIRNNTARKSITPEFQTIEFRAHWALLVKMILKPLILLCLALWCMRFFRNAPDIENIRKIIIIVIAISAVWIGYQIVSWRNHRFSIEKDCVKDYSRQPLAREDQNLAMNHKIQSVRFTKRGFFQVMLNYGTVYILAGEGELSFDYVSDPQYVQQQIKETCARYEAGRFQQEEALRREYTDNFNSDHYQDHLQ